MAFQVDSSPVEFAIFWNDTDWERTMRPLTAEETKAVFESEPHQTQSADITELSNYIGKNLVHLIDRDEDDAYCFRLHKDRFAKLPHMKSIAEVDRVHYLPLPMLHLATSIARPNLISLGTCFGKFSKTGKFKLGVTSLDWLAKYAKHKVSIPVGSVAGGGQKTRKGTRKRSSCVDMDQTRWGITFPLR